MRERKGVALRRILWTCAIVASAVVAFVVLVVYGYGSVGVEQSGESLLVVDLNSEWTLSDLRDPETPLIRGMTANATVDVRNSTFVPLYLPAMEHQMSVGGEPVGSPLSTPSMWLGPWGKDSMEVSTYIPREELPGLIMEYLLSGGDIDMTVESTGEVAGYTITRTQTVPYVVSNPVLSLRGV
jgi:hypothetical protein